MTAPAVIGVGYPRPVIALRLVAVGTDLFPQPVIPVIEIAGHPSCRIGSVGRPVFQVIPGAALQTFPVRSQNGLFQHISGRIVGILHPSVDTVLSVKDSLLEKRLTDISSLDKNLIITKEKNALSPRHKVL